MRIYRWHVVRKFAHPELNPELAGVVDVVITPARDHFPSYRFEKAPNSLFELPSDSLDFWESEDELKLEGWTKESTLLESIFERNLLQHAKDIEVSRDDRRIVEDMVLLQVLKKDERGFAEAWGKAKSDLDLPDVTDVATWKGAQWLDYTQPARQLTKRIYRKVLEASREAGNAKQYRST